MDSRNPRWKTRPSSLCNTCSFPIISLIMETIELSGIIGLIAIACLASNFIVGFFILSNSKIKLPFGLSFLSLHKFTGYSAAISILVHVLLIPLDPKSEFSWSDLLLPLWTKHQPYANTFGALA